MMRHNFTIHFDEPISTEAAGAAHTLMMLEVRRWGGFRGRSISKVELDLLEFPEGAHGDVAVLRVDGLPAEAADEVLDAFRELLLRPRPFGIGQARVTSFGVGEP